MSLRESKALIDFRKKWKGKRVRYYKDKVGLVDDVCDDGGRCDHDARRRYKPTGYLIVKRDDGSDVDYPCYWQCVIIDTPNKGAK